MGCDIFIAGCQQHGSSHHYRGKESYFSLLHLERHDHDERPNLPHQPPGEASRWPWAPVREGAKRVSRSGAIIEKESRRSRRWRSAKPLGRFLLARKVLD
jgi:hypothetical protein